MQLARPFSPGPVDQLTSLADLSFLLFFISHAHLLHPTHPSTQICCSLVLTMLLEPLHALLTLAITSTRPPTCSWPHQRPAQPVLPHARSANASSSNYSSCNLEQTFSPTQRLFSNYPSSPPFVCPKASLLLPTTLQVPHIKGHEEKSLKVEKKTLEQEKEKESKGFGF